MRGILCFSSWSEGPIPEIISKWGDAIAPAHNTISLASERKISPPLSTSTPTAVFSLKTIRFVVQFALIVRFNLCLLCPRYPTDVLNLTPPGLFRGYGPTPVASGKL